MPRTPTYDRDDVLEKALNLFWEKGFQGTSMKDLETSLEMHPGSIYAAFGSKEKLFEEALRLYGARSREALDRTLADAPGALHALAEHVRNVGRGLVKDNPARACMLVKTVLETPDDDPALRRSAEALLQDVEKSFAETFQLAKEKGELAADADADHLANWLQMQIFGLRTYAQRADAAPKVKSLAEDIARAVEHLGK